MGRSKALLSCEPGGEPFVVRLVAAIRAGGASDVVVVGRQKDDELRCVVEGAGARYVENAAAAEGGQLSSLLAGLDAVVRPEVRGLLVTPVDVPLVDDGTVEALLRAFAANRSPIVRAVHHGRHGHPVVFSRDLFDELRHADPAMGAKAVLRAHETEILDVEVVNPGVVDDVDTPEDYERLLSQDRERDSRDQRGHDRAQEQPQRRDAGAEEPAE